MRKIWRLSVLFFIILMLYGCTKGSADGNTEAGKTELMVSAAASLTDALQELKPRFENEHPDVTLTFNFGSSSKLAQMITQGAPSDVFLSASEKDMNTLHEAGFIIEESRVDFAKNELVLITNKEHPASWTSFEDIDPATVGHFSIGEPGSVPVGAYTKEALEHLALWEPLQNNLVFGSDVRQVLTHVEMRNAEIGIVYATDALTSSKVEVLATANPEWHGPIIYPGAAVSESKHVEEAKQFLTFLAGEQSKDVLTKYGFK